MKKIIGASSVGVTFYYWVPDDAADNFLTTGINFRGVDVDGRPFEMVLPVDVVREILAVIDGGVEVLERVTRARVDALSSRDSYLDDDVEGRQ